MTGCGECVNCGSNWRGIVTDEKILGDVVFLTRWCCMCGHEEDAGSITRESLEHLHNEVNEK